MLDVPALGVGLARSSRRTGRVLDTFFVDVHVDDALERARGLGLGDEAETIEAADLLPATATQVTGPLAGELECRAVAVWAPSLAAPPRDAHDVYLRLHLLSRRLVRPHDASLDDVFALLTSVAWTNHGPLDAEELDAVRRRLRLDGLELRVPSIDKFPRMTDYVAPSGVRVADADRVRLGAHLAAGTTVMHEGFVNFDAGTLGPSMIEGRISAGVVVGAHSDVGGGASIMGTLSGGGKDVISVGEHSLVGANAGIGISLGDHCVVEAGLYVTAGMPVTLPDGEVVKARELSGRDGLLFLRDGRTGAVGVQPRQRGIELNAALHAN